MFVTGSSAYFGQGLGGMMGFQTDTTFLTALTNGMPRWSLSDNYLSVFPGVGFRIQDDTTTSTAAAALPVSGDYRRLMRTTSLRRFKRLIEDAAVTAADFAALRPRSWFDSREVEDAGLDGATVTEAEAAAAGLRRIPGFIAEEVENVNPLFCTYNTGGELEGISYDRLTVAAHAAFTALEARVAALEAA
jgi:hypothetical protein